MKHRLLTVCGSLQRLSANRAALDVARSYLETRGNIDVDDFTGLAEIPPLNTDLDVDHGPAAVRAWRQSIAGADAVLIAAPEYAGALAGTIKNALDWIVGSGELYAKPVAVMSAGTTGGRFARQMLVQTLTWQGAHVVAETGITGPRTKSDPSGRLTDPDTIADIERVAAALADALTLDAPSRLDLVRDVVVGAGVDTGHIAPLSPIA
jgi:chromate reductase